MTLPKGFEDESDEFIHNFFESQTEEQLMSLQENHRISSYLETTNLWEQVTSKMEYGQLYVDMDLNKFLTEQQHVDLSNYIAPTTNEKCQWTWIWCFTGSETSCPLLVGNLYRCHKSLKIICSQLCFG